MDLIKLLLLADHDHEIGMECKVKGGFTSEHIVQARWWRQKNRDGEIGLQG